MANNVIQLLIKAQDLASSELRKVEKATSDLDQALVPLKNGMKLAALAIGVAGVASVKMAGDFEQSLNIFKSVTDATAQQMALVSEKARELGKDAALPGISAKDAAAAMTELAKAGLSVNDTLAASKGVLSLAKAGQLEVSDAAKITSQALNAFKLSGQDAAKVADALSAGANASAADVQGMALGLQQSAAVANEFGISLNDTVTALALFANRGIQGSDAGTSLKTMLIHLANPSKEAAELMEDLGLKAYDANGQFVGLRQLAINLKDSLSGLTQEQQNAALATVFGTDAFRAAAFLADSAGQSYDDMSKKIGKVGAATDLAKAQNSGFKGALDNLKSTLETMATDIGMKVLPPLTEFLKKLSSSGIFDAVVKHLDLIAIALGTLGTMFVAIKIGQFISSIISAVNALKLATGATSLFNLVLMANPIMLIVLGVIALIAILVALQVRFEFVTKAITWVAESAVAAWNWIKDAFQTAIDWVVQHWDLILTIMLGPIGYFIAQVIKHWDDIKAAFKATMDAIVNIAQAIWHFIYDGIIKPIFGLITAVFNVWWAVVSYIFAVFRGLVIVTFEFLWNNVVKPIIDLFVGAFQFWWGIVQIIFNAVKEFITKIWNWIWDNVLKPVIDRLVEGFQNIWNKVVEVFNAIKGVVQAAMNWVWNNIISPIFNRVKSGFQNIWEAASNVFNNIKDAMGAVGEAISSGFSKAFDKAKDIMKSAVNWMIDKINVVIRSVNSSAGKLPGVPDIPQIPKLASGTPNFTGGLTMVGERGRELVALPGGSRVMNNTQTEDALRGSGGLTLNFYGPTYMRNEQEVTDIMNRVARQYLTAKAGSF